MARQVETVVEMPSRRALLSQRALPIAEYAREVRTGVKMGRTQCMQLYGSGVAPIPVPLRPGEDLAQYEARFAAWLYVSRNRTLEAMRMREPNFERSCRFAFARMEARAFDFVWLRAIKAEVKEEEAVAAETDKEEEEEEEKENAAAARGEGRTVEFKREPVSVEMGDDEEVEEAFAAVRGESRIVVVKRERAFDDDDDDDAPETKKRLVQKLRDLFPDESASPESEGAESNGQLV